MNKKTEWTYLFFFNDTATTEIYTLSLHDALPICRASPPSTEPSSAGGVSRCLRSPTTTRSRASRHSSPRPISARVRGGDRKSTRLNSSHANISYAVFCLKKKKIHYIFTLTPVFIA